MTKDECIILRKISRKLGEWINRATHHANLMEQSDRQKIANEIESLTGDCIIKRNGEYLC